ncbi:hypothetical protein [Corynebacterium sp.]|uniref:hypothetical protein n=1 Tax=Corynebacterium sp. TaxID=1720 RepID=UPI0026DFEEAF|nr:hypothetical protein [Corynebacterium sp.]MDO5512835.1 hypothetical protein [Corynebacterium sp.]
MNKRIAATIVGSTLILLPFHAPSALAEGTGEIIKSGDKCYVEKTMTEEEVVGTRSVAEHATRDGEWPVGDITGPEGWTFERPESTGPNTAERTVTASIPADTPVGEYTATVYHFSHNKNQVTEVLPFTVVEEEITETRTWKDREEIPCAVDGTGHDNENGDVDGAQSQVLSENAANFIDHKAIAQQQALNAPAAPAAPAAAAKAAPAEVTPAPAAQQVQLANNGTSGVLGALAVALLAVAGGAMLLLRRRA